MNKRPTMIPEEQNIAIATACGWTNIEHTDRIASPKFSYVGTDPTDPLCQISLRPDKGPSKKYIPDYLNDLNAMHEAECQCTNLMEYLIQLSLVVNRCRLNVKDDARILANYILNLVKATAAQRAEAFLKCLGLWKES